VLALLNRPRLVILDELTQGLDPAARRGVWDAIRQLNDDGTTVLLVTHEMDEAEILCDRVLVMRSGRVLDAGTPADLVDRHAAVATIRFSLAASPPRVPERTGRHALEETGRSLLEEIGRIDGVHSVDRDGYRVVVRGERRVAAHVCAALVRCDPVPDDLRVQVPTLEDALLELLSGPPVGGRPGSGQPASGQPEPALVEGATA
jgi:ABC-2 type transport system ATP-binding protein